RASRTKRPRVARSPRGRVRPQDRGMRTRTRAARGHVAVITDDNQVMAESAGSPLRRVIEAPFTRRAWSELGYTLASAWLSVAAVAFLVPTLANGVLWGLSAGPLRRF